MLRSISSPCVLGGVSRVGRPIGGRYFSESCFCCFGPACCPEKVLDRSIDHRPTDRKACRSFPPTPLRLPRSFLPDPAAVPSVKIGCERIPRVAGPAILVVRPVPPGERAGLRGVAPPEDPKVPGSDCAGDEAVQQRPLSGMYFCARQQLTN